LFSLDPMAPSHDPLTLICGGVYILLTLYIAGLWAFCLFRTGMVFCYFYILAAVVGIFISVVSVAMSRSVHLGAAARQRGFANLVLHHHSRSTNWDSDRSDWCHNISQVAHQEV
jgi:hypothetical protein